MAVLLLVGRILIALMFLVSGYAALTDITGTAGYFESLGMPMPTIVTVLTGLFEVAAGVLLVVGFQTRLVAAALAAFSVVASFMGHFGQGEGMMAFWHMQMFYKDIAVAGGLLAFVAYGAGQYSMDGRR